ncbi:MAG TPA: hypothetical protein VGH14_22165 [Solirubrobacterales bacterium]|jgi:hypothetical protein
MVSTTGNRHLRVVDRLMGRWRARRDGGEPKTGRGRRAAGPGGTREGFRGLTLRRPVKLALSALVVGVLGSFAAIGVYGVYTATTQNAGNEITSGTVAFTDNDAGAALYNVTGVKPGETITRCIKTTYTGSLPAVVHLYSPSTAGPLAQYIELTITQGTQASSTFPSCTGFAPDSTGTIYTGTLQSFEQTRNTYANGVTTVPVGKSSWSAGEALVYRFQATLVATAPDSSQGWSSGVHSFTWEAHSQ